MLYAGAWTGFAGAFFLGFLISRLRASLFPMHRACHRLLMVARASGGWGFTRVSQNDRKWTHPVEARRLDAMRCGRYTVHLTAIHSGCHFKLA
jgi:hypothetical protein